VTSFSGRQSWKHRRYYPVRRDVSIADRAFFIRHRTQGIGKSINEPLDGRFGGVRIFNMSKVRRNGDGGFAGVASVSFSPQYFSDFYRQVVGSDGVIAIALLRSDGEVVARYPGFRRVSDSWPDKALKSAMKDGATHGAVTAVVGVDGERRYVAFRRVESYPLFIAVSRTHSSVFSEWRHDMASVSLFVLPCACIMIAAIWLAIAREEKEYETILRLHEEEAKRRDAEDHLRQLEKYEALGQLTGGLTHDFNNLLQIISSNTALMSAMSPEMDRRQQLSAIDRAVSRGRSLTTHLLAFARRRELALERVQPGSEVPRMLELAILNMTLNARDAMKDGGVITVHVRNVPRSGTERLVARLPESDLVALSVSDRPSRRLRPLSATPFVGAIAARCNPGGCAAPGPTGSSQSAPSSRTVCSRSSRRNGSPRACKASGAAHRACERRSRRSGLQSTFSPATFTTFAHFPSSFRMNVPNASGVMSTGSAPNDASRSSASGSCTERSTAALSR